jgi:hypothetical protein
MQGGHASSIGDHSLIISVVSDEEANEIYLLMAAQASARKGFIKKNWGEDETKLLKWAVITYTKQKNMSYSNLVGAGIAFIMRVVGHG